MQKGEKKLIDGVWYEEKELCSNCGQAPRTKETSECVRCYVERKL